MKRRHPSRGKQAKSRQTKAASLKVRDAPKAVRHRAASKIGQETVVARLTRERDEALLREAANAEILRLVSKSGDLETVFGTILENATRICNATYGTLLLFENGAFRRIAHRNAPQRLIDEWQKNPVFFPILGSALDRLVKTKNTLHIDAATGDALGQLAALADARTLLQVPMLSDDELIGSIGIYRQEVRQFTDKQIGLVENFAAQAVIAIENARLLNELRESLQQQTASADVLRIISSSPGDLTPVFNAILQNAVRICEANFGNLFLCDGNTLELAAMLNAAPALAEFLNRRGRFEPTPGVALDRLLKTRQVVHSLDEGAEPVPSASARLAGARTMLVVPMLKEENLVGAVAIYRKQVRPFSEKQIELVKNFAAQAVIAIENARLLSELRESLQQQTASADVLRIISSSPGELEPVFSAILKNAVNLCEATLGNLFLYNSEDFVSAAVHASSPDYAASRRPGLVIRHPHPEVPLNRLARTKELIHIADVRTEKAYIERDPVFCELVDGGGARTLLVVPMTKEQSLVGAVAVYRQEVHPFTDQQIELVKNFAAQAVIAIENARLLSELRERTDQLEVQSGEVVKLNQQLEARVADQVGEIERMGRLRRFLPPQVADLIVASGTERQLESHRREITALFCDLRGFTGFSESSDPEDVMTLLRQYHAAIGEIIIQYSGTLERYAGDGVMVVFNDPVPVDNPALQAVRMALDMRAALGALIEKWRRLGHELGFGIGIAHGYATLGTIGFEGRFDYAAIGTVSNVASRLCDEAKPGQILISPRVLMAIEDAVGVEAVGDFVLKGISRPLAAYNVVGMK